MKIFCYVLGSFVETLGILIQFIGDAVNMSLNVIERIEEWCEKYINEG